MDSVGMDYNAILERILNTVDRESYLYNEGHLSPQDAAAQRKVHQALADPTIDVAEIRQMIEAMASTTQIDGIVRLSLLHVVAAHPRIKDYPEAARLVGEQEVAAWKAAGPDMERQLAAVERHRGVLAFLMGQYEYALDHFARALERERTPDNLHNVLAALLRLGEVDDARSLLDQIRKSYPAPVVQKLDHTIRHDPDLALLRQELP
jgi:tetratricopeptide (TPR) repeat protein